jgi:hypothetical protein
MDVNRVSDRQLGPDTAAEWESRVANAAAMLAVSASISDDVRSVVSRLGRVLVEFSRDELSDVDPYFLLALQRGALLTLLSLDEEDPLIQRRGVRLGLETMRQALRDVADTAAVAESVSPRQIAAWLVDVLDVSNAEVADLIDVAPRTFQRWLSPKETVEPHGVDAARLRIAARVANQLRHSLTGPGVVAWLYSPNRELKDQRPVDLLHHLESTPDLVRLAAGTRVSAAT